ncbi:innexin unc-9-like [Haliotis asinina]|uniref:innexin unc-9-like n=1 Tax=Haliotis asinina TaxID=109174 RepID=UPI00353228C3
MLGTLLEVANKIAVSRGSWDDDGVDQLHHIVSVALFAALGVAVGAKQYVGDPIHCWTPAQFAGSHHSYAEGYCWISHMYYVPMDDPIPFKVEDRFERDISFYRWVAVMFLIQAVLFKVPNIIWKEVKTYSGINVQKIVRMADEAMMSPPKDRVGKIDNIGHFIDRWLVTYRVYKYNILIRMREKISGILCFVLGKRHGTFLTGLYLFCKFLNVCNCIGQFFLMTRFLGWNFWSYGFEIMNVLNSKGHWEDWEHFPRVAMCDFDIRQQQNIQRYSVQCALSINLFVEKMYAFAWFWMIFLMCATIVNFGKWVFDIFFRRRREQFVAKYIGLADVADDSHEKKLFKKFVSHYLRDDGVFLLRSVRNNTGHIVALDLVNNLWNRFKDQHLGKEDGILK